MTEEERAYNSADFVFAAVPLQNPGDTLPAKVGAPAPEFEARSLEGGTARLKQMRAGRHVVLMAGAVTSPMCAVEIPAMNRLQEEFGDRGVSFYLVYTRESHPAERYPPHASFEEKVSRARELRTLENVRFPILVDDLAGTIHRTYGPWPNALFVVHRDGRLVYRTNMANAKALRQFLEDLLTADLRAVEGRVLHTEYVERIVGHEADQATHRRIYERAGPQAFEDSWRRRPDLRGRWP
jgi:alkyl hydroperoxide reductase subunit AhpC